MKKSILISYWSVAIIMVAGVLTSLGYKFGEALFIGTTFLPGALAAMYFFPRARKEAQPVKSIIFLTLGIIVAQIFIILLAHLFISFVREEAKYIYEYRELPEILMNPIFIAIMTAGISGTRPRFPTGKPTWAHNSSGFTAHILSTGHSLPEPTRIPST